MTPDDAGQQAEWERRRDIVNDAYEGIIRIRSRVAELPRSMEKENVLHHLREAGMHLAKIRGVRPAEDY